MCFFLYPLQLIFMLSKVKKIHTIYATLTAFYVWDSTWAIGEVTLLIPMALSMADSLLRKFCFFSASLLAVISFCNPHCIHWWNTSVCAWMCISITQNKQPWKYRTNCLSIHIFITRFCKMAKANLRQTSFINTNNKSNFSSFSCL